MKEVCALRGKFGPLLSQKLKVALHEKSPNWFIRKIAEMQNSGFYFTFTVAMVTKMADKIGLK